ncbi:MAG: ArsR family transcriptional regulator [Leptospiraceae bacterium]|nr:MAG: ArsR family transcriptional regulator [Leptospiraceae bacterium]
MNTLDILKALSDETRIRIFYLLLYEPLHVTEILEILKMGQSRVSRHLKILQDAKILSAARDGARMYYGISPEFRLHPLYDSMIQIKENFTQKFWEEELQNQFKKDQNHLFELLEKRKSATISFFEKFGDLLELNQNLYVDSDFYRKKILDLLPENISLCVEPGCGTGWVSIELIKKVKKMICIDQSQSSLNKIKEKLNPEDLNRIELITAPMEEMPLKDQIADLVVLSMALHHTPNIYKVLKETYRILKNNGYLIIAELEHHNIEDMRKKFADFWLGFHIEDLKKELMNLNFKNIETYKGKGKGKLQCIFIKCTK